MERKPTLPPVKHVRYREAWKASFLHNLPAEWRDRRQLGESVAKQAIGAAVSATAGWWQTAIPMLGSIGGVMTVLCWKVWRDLRHTREKLYEIQIAPAFSTLENRIRDLCDETALLKDCRISMQRYGVEIAMWSDADERTLAAIRQRIQGLGAVITDASNAAADTLRRLPRMLQDLGRRDLVGLVQHATHRNEDKLTTALNVFEQASSKDDARQELYSVIACYRTARESLECVNRAIPQVAESAGYVHWAAKDDALWKAINTACAVTEMHEVRRYLLPNNY